MMNIDPIALQKAFMHLTILIDGTRMRQQVMEQMLEVMLEASGRDRAMHTVLETRRRFEAVRKADANERHPDAEASALQLLARFQQVAEHAGDHGT